MGEVRIRLEWVDAVKATSVVLVVFMHAVSTLGIVADGTPVDTFWGQVGGLLEPLRMPVFFLVSGMLAAGAVHQPWGAARRRTLGTAYLYVLWSMVLAAVITIVTLDPASLLALPRTLLFAPNGYWYLYALVVYFFAARLARNLPATLVVGAAALPNLLRPVNDAMVSTATSPWTDSTMLGAVTFNLSFFLAGAYGKQLFVGIARRADWRIVAALLAVAVVGGIWRALTPALWPHTFLPFSILWMVAAVMAAARLTRHDGVVRRFGGYVGPRTLPIFVLQFPVLVVIQHWFADGGPALLQHPAAQLVYPLAVTAMMVVAALCLYDIAVSGPVRWLFVAPDWVVDLGRGSNAPVPSIPPRTRRLAVTASQA